MTTQYDEMESGERYPLIDELLDETDELFDEADETYGQFETSRPAAGAGFGPPCADCGSGAVCEVLDGFGFDKDWITGGHFAKIAAIAARVSQSHATGRPIQVVRVIGHTDPVGTAQYNIGLGLRRATTVMKAIESELKKPQYRLTQRVVFVPTSRGESQQVSRDPARNRRVEVCLVAVAAPRPCDRQQRDRLVRECESIYWRCLLSCGLAPLWNLIKAIPRLAPCLLKGPDPRRIILCALLKGGKGAIDNFLEANQCTRRCKSNRGLCETKARSASRCPT
jgi:hypothetical protein